MQMAAMQIYATDMFEHLEELVRKSGRVIVRVARNIPKAYKGTFVAVKGLVSLLDNISKRDRLEAYERLSFTSSLLCDLLG